MSKKAPSAAGRTPAMPASYTVRLLPIPGPSFPKRCLGNLEERPLGVLRTFPCARDRARHETRPVGGMGAHFGIKFYTGGA